MRPAAPELSGRSVPAGPAKTAGGGAAPAGCAGAGAGAERQAACRGRRAEEPPPQQETPGGPRGAESGWEGHDDADDLLHGSCKKLKCLDVASF